MLLCVNSPRYAISVSAMPSRDHATLCCVHVICATTFTPRYLSPHELCYHILNFTQARGMPALAMNHATSCGCHMIQLRNDAIPEIYLPPSRCTSTHRHQYFIYHLHYTHAYFPYNANIRIQVSVIIQQYLI